MQNPKWLPNYIRALHGVQHYIDLYTVWPIESDLVFTLQPGLLTVDLASLAIMFIYKHIY